jgi:acetyl-CoA acetyltransferase
VEPDALLCRKFASVWPMLDERARRLLAASEALVLPYGGVSRVHRACGLSRKAIAKGIREIQSGAGRGRAGAAPRAGRKPITVHDPQPWRRWTA